MDVIFGKGRPGSWVAKKIKNQWKHAPIEKEINENKNPTKAPNDERLQYMKYGRWLRDERLHEAIQKDRERTRKKDVVDYPETATINLGNLIFQSTIDEEKKDGFRGLYVESSKQS